VVGLFRARPRHTRWSSPRRGTRSAIEATPFAREEAYRRLAEECTASQRETARRLEAAQAELSVLGERTAALEHLLKEVEEPWAR